MRTLNVLLLSVMALAVADSASADGDAPRESKRMTLKGLTGVGVIVEPLAPNVERRYLRGQQIHADVERRLQQAGISVLKEDEILSTPGKPFLFINLNLLEAEIDGRVRGFYYSLSVSLNQVVRLERDPAIRLFGAATWRIDLLGTAPLQGVQEIRDSIDEKVDVFISHYLALNPKKGTPDRENGESN